MEEVTKRDFLHRTESYIRPSTFILTRHKVPQFVVTISVYTEAEPDKQKEGTECVKAL